MTNLIGTIGFIITTNWTTVGVEKPECHAIGCRESHYESVYQSGVVTTSTVLSMDWRGQRKEIVLESSEEHVTRIGKVMVAHTNAPPPLLVSKASGTNKLGVLELEDGLELATNGKPRVQKIKPKK